MPPLMVACGGLRPLSTYDHFSGATLLFLRSLPSLGGKNDLALRSLPPLKNRFSLGIIPVLWCYAHTSCTPMMRLARFMSEFAFGMQHTRGLSSFPRTAFVARRQIILYFWSNSNRPNIPLSDPDRWIHFCCDILRRVCRHVRSH